MRRALRFLLFLLPPFSWSFLLFLPVIDDFSRRRREGKGREGRDHVSAWWKRRIVVVVVDKGKRIYIGEKGKEER